MDLQNLNLNLYLIRHAAPLNKAGYWTSAQSPLDEKGKLQADLLGSKLKNVKFNKIITSPFIRTKQTAEILLNHLEYYVSPKVEPWLGEIDLGDYAGKSKGIIKSNLKGSSILQIEKAVAFEPLVARILSETNKFDFPGGESLHQFWNRVKTGFFTLLDEYRNNKEFTLGLVGHGGSFTVIQALLMNKSFEDSFHSTSAIEMGKFALLRIFNNRIIYLRLN